jgi:hypothetical protein
VERILEADEHPEQDWRLSDPRHDAELWRILYECSPYLEYASDDALDKRYTGIINNVHHLVCQLRDARPTGLATRIIMSNAWQDPEVPARSATIKPTQALWQNFSR